MSQVKCYEPRLFYGPANKKILSLVLVAVVVAIIYVDEVLED